MIETEKSGGPMHPQQFLVRGIGGDQQIIVVGASLLDMYAAAALQGIIASDPPSSLGDDEVSYAERVRADMAHVARMAFDHAAAMLEERKRRLPHPVPPGAQ
jgi:hypothetical protein